MSKKLVLYGVISSPPVRSVRILAKALNVELEFKTVNVFQRENLKEEYLKINPNHKIPSLEDNGFIVWDSHAIMMYLMDKYAKNDSLYPKDLQKRTIVHQLLFFDAEIFEKLRTIVILLYSGVLEIPADKIEGVEDSYKSLNRLLQGNSYFTGKTVAICDISLLTTLLALELVVPINSEAYPNIKAWMSRMEDQDYIANKPIITFRKKKSTISEESKRNLFEKIEILEKLLTGKNYVAGNNLTIADYSLIAWVSTLDCAFPLSTTKFTNISAWWKRLQEIPSYEANREGLNSCAEIWASRD